MRLARIKVVNYRHVPDFEIEVGEHLVLIGPTDSGKSSVLNALDLLLGASFAYIFGQISIRDFTNPGSSLLFEAELQEFSDEDRAAFPDAISVGPPERLVIRLEIQIDPADPELVTAARTLPEGGPAQVPTREQLGAIGWRFVPARRSLARELGGGRSSVVRELLRAVDLAEDRATITAAIDDMREALDSATALTTFREDLANALTTALPDAVSEEDVRLVTESDSEDDPLGGVTIGLRRAGLISRLTEQSDGVQTLSTLALLSMAHRQSNIVGIDEPETHLHPTACRAVGSLLRRQTGQRVIATHSSHLASQFAPLELVALGPDRVARQITPAVPAAQAKFIARWWDSSLIEPLTARKVAVVEGAADRVLVQGAAAATNTPLDQMDVAVVELGGAGNFNTVYRFLGPDGFGVPLFGLCDEDHRSAWAAAIGVADQGLEAEGFRVANPDLEAEYVSSLGVPRVFELLVGSALFTDAEILQSCQVTDVAAISAGGLIEFCRAKKVMAAAGVASQLTAADVAALGPVQSLLADLR